MVGAQVKAASALEARWLAGARCNDAALAAAGKEI